MSAQGSTNEPPNARELLKALSEQNSSVTDEECAICMEKFGVYRGKDLPAERAVVLPGCNHVVGLDCISKWLSRENGAKTTCPMCRNVLCTPALGETLELRETSETREILQMREPWGTREIRSAAEWRYEYPWLDTMDIIRLQRQERLMGDLFQPHLHVPLRNRVRDTVSAHPAPTQVDLDDGVTESRGLTHMRQWLRRRLEPNPPRRQEDINHWFANVREPSQHFNSFSRGINLGRMWVTELRERYLYDDLREVGVPLPSLDDTPHDVNFESAHEDAFLQELVRRGAFRAYPESSRGVFQNGASIRGIWTVFHEEGYVYAECFDDELGSSYHGWVGLIIFDEPRLENGQTRRLTGPRMF